MRLRVGGAIRFVAAAILVCALFGLSTTSLLADHEHLIDPATHGHESYWSWRGGPSDGTPYGVTYFIDASLTANMADRVRDAMTEWNNADADLVLTEVGTAGAGDIDVYLDTGITEGSAPGGVLGQSNVSYTGGHTGTHPDGTPYHQITNNEIHMDIAETWYDGTGSPGVGEFDFWSVVLHEIGHSIGMGHAAGAGEAGSVMWPTIGSGPGSENRTLTANDIATIQLTMGAGVPEPGTFALYGLGLAAMALARRRRRKSEENDGEEIA